MNVAQVMTGIKTRLDTITGLRAFAYAPDNLAPPAAIIGLPTEYRFDLTYGRGSDSAIFPVTVVVGKVSDRASQVALAEYLDGSGAKSVKAAVEAAGVGGGADSVRVTGAEIATVTVASVEYLAATFSLEVVG